MVAYKSYTFICGCGHSGTTLLANMFAAHPTVAIPFRESEAFMGSSGIAPPDRNAQGDWLWEPRRWRDLLQELKPLKRRHFVEKTPRHLYVMDLIKDVVPQAKFILMVRNGRDVAASFIKRTGKMDEGLGRWMHDNTIVRAYAGTESVYLQRYEDLIEDPGQSLRAICKFSGVPFRKAMLNYHLEKRSWFGIDGFEKGNGRDGHEHRKLRNWQVNQPMFDGRNTWKSLLTKQDLAKFDAPDVTEMMQFFDYAPS